MLVEAPVAPAGDDWKGDWKDVVEPAEFGVSDDMVLPDVVVVLVVVVVRTVVLTDSVLLTSSPASRHRQTTPV